MSNMNGESWTRTEVAKLKRWAGVAPYAEIAARLGRTEYAVQSAAARFAVSTRSYWRAADDEAMRARYGREPIGQLARSLGRTVTAVYQRAGSLGLVARNFRWTDAARDTLRRLNAEGRSDAEIAASLGVDRKAVGRQRRAMRLPDRNRETGRKKVASQLRSLGLTAPNQLRIASWAAGALDAGWPTTINGRAVNRVHVAILDSLHASGPATSRELADRIGRAWKGRSCKTWASNGPGGSYTAELIRAGLVVSLGKVAKGKGRGHSRVVYSLALDVRKETGADHGA